MTRGNQRSVEELKRESERTRAGLVDTVDLLRARASETATDIRERISPDAIKAEVGDYFRTRGERLIDKARENPLQAAAIGAGLAYPLIGIVRSIPIPVLMIGAGLFLMGSKTGQALSRDFTAKASDVADRVGEGVEAVRRNMHDARDYAAGQFSAASGAMSAGVDALKQNAMESADRASEAAASARDSAVAFGGAASQRATDVASGAKESAAAFAGSAAGMASDAAGAARESAAALSESLASQTDQARNAAAAAASRLQGAVGSAAQYSAETAAAARDRAAEAADRAATMVSDTMQRNPLLVGGLGLVVGAFIAACLPRSDFEKDAMGGASKAVQNRAKDLAAQGVEAAKSVASAAYSGAAERARQEGLSPDDLQATAHGLGERIRKVADTAASTAFDRSDEQVH